MVNKNYKVCLLGDSAVGKTTTVRRYVHKIFDDRYRSTIGTSIEFSFVDVDGENVSLLVWDILGEPGFESLRSQYFKQAQGAIFVCDVTRLSSLESHKEWLTQFLEVNPDAPIVIFCNKWDIPDRKMTLEQVQAVANEYGAECLTTSAKTGDNVEKGFYLLGKKMLAKREEDNFL